MITELGLWSWSSLAALLDHEFDLNYQDQVLLSYVLLNQEFYPPEYSSDQQMQVHFPFLYRIQLIEE